MISSHAILHVNIFVPAASGHNTPLISLPLDAHDAPLPAIDFVDLSINYQWRRLLAPLAARLLNRRIYDGTDTEIDAAIQQVFALLADLYPIVEIMVLSVALLFDEKPSGVQGGSSLVGWNARDLNTISSDPNNIVTLAANKFVPIPGLYAAITTTTAMAGGISTTLRGRLRNVTSGVISGASNSGLYPFSATAQNVFLSIFVANGTDEYQVDSYTSVARATTGLGFGVFDGSPEKYSTVLLLRIS